jgi:cell wall-associated NlpC family hydrolase
MTAIPHVAFVEGGRDAEKDGGLDCWGFFRLMRSVAGLPVPPDDVIGYEGGDAPVERGRASGRWTRVPKAEPGCLVLFDRIGRGRRFHVGMVLGDGVSFAHCQQGGSRVDRLDSPVYAARKKTYYRYR